MTTKITADNIEQSTLDALTSGPAVANVQVANSSYGLLDDTAVDVGGGYILINGSKFASGCSVLIGNTPATSVTYVSATQLRAQVPAKTAGSYVMYVSNPDGGTAIIVNGITFSNTPVWATNSTLPQQDSGVAISIQLSAPSDSNVSYYVAAGSSLPSGASLAANGLLSGTVTVDEETTYNFTVDAVDAENQDQSRSFSVTIVAGDIYYNLTTLHLNGEPPADAWISDASTNKFPLTASGDTRPVAFSPYETVWSNYFDGNDTLTTPSNSAFTYGTSDFTVEGWFYFTGGVGASGYSYIFAQGAGTGSTSLGVYIQSGVFRVWNGSAVISSTASFVQNIWTHIAVTRSGTSMRLFVNGNLEGTVTNSNDITTGSTTGISIGRWSEIGDTNYITGYVSNFRSVKGTALYTSNFTPPTSPLTAVSGTSLLTCQSNRLIDNSTNNFTITRNGDVSVSNFGPFTETDLVTGSAYFDGTGDYLSLGSNSAFGFGTSDFTVEFWVYMASRSGTWRGLFDIGDYTSGILMRDQVSPDSLYLAGTSYDWMPNTYLKLNEWNHVALTRSGTSLKAFVNGNAVLSATNSSNLGSSQDLFIGESQHASGQTWPGYMSNFRILKGTALYTTNFTPPTSPLTAIANTSLLTLQNRFGENNNRFVDTSGIDNLITRAGNSSQGTFSPFSQAGWSGSFNGSNDPVSLASTTSLNIEAVDFTVEAWIYMNVMPTATSTTSWTSDFSSWFVIYERSGGGTTGWQFRVGATLLTLGGTGDSSIAWGNHGMIANRWYHVAVTRQSGTYRLFVNGVSLSLTTQGISMATSGTYYIGSEDTSGANFNGFISNLRVIKDQAIYTGNFTPSTTALTTTTIGSTGAGAAASLTGTVSLLTCNSARWIDNSTNNNAISRTGTNTKTVNFSPFKPITEWSANTVGGSMYFDGTGDYLSCPNNASLNPNTADFIMEAWVYITGTTGNNQGFNGKGTAGTDGYSFFITNALVLSFIWNGTGGATITAGTLKLNTWHHVAVVRNSGVIRLYLDGVGAGSSTTCTTDITTTGIKFIGQARGANPMRGYMSGYRMIRGDLPSGYNATASTITIPPSPLERIRSTSLLLSGTNGGIIDYTSRNNLETVGDTKLSYDVKKFGNASMYFDGTGDRVIVPSDSGFDFGTGNFTIEMWINFTDVTSTWEAIISRAYGVAGGWRLYKNQSNNQLRWYHDTTSIVLTTGSTLANNTWSHIAAVRNNGVMTIYIDGTSRGSASDTNNYNPGVYALEIGEGVVTSAFPFQGYIDDLRITKGFARYTSNFTPPTSAFKIK